MVDYRPTVPPFDAMFPATNLSQDNVFQGNDLTDLAIGAGGTTALLGSDPMLQDNLFRNNEPPVVPQTGGLDPTPARAP